jgi:translocator protein
MPSDSVEPTATTADKVSSFLVLLATAGMIGFNALASTGLINGVLTSDVSTRFPTVITPAGWAFSIWLVIYAGLSGFTVYQLLPAKLVEFRPVRTLYIVSCVLNCLWLWLWHSFQIAGSVVVIIGLWAVLLMLNSRLHGGAVPFLDGLLGKGVFGLYLGWVTAASLVNILVLLVSMEVNLLPAAWSVVGVIMILLAASAAVLARFKLRNFTFPLAIAWAAAGIVVASAAALVVGLVLAVSFVMDRKSTLE